MRQSLFGKTSHTRWALVWVIFGFTFLFVKILSSDQPFITPLADDDVGYLAWTQAIFVTGTVNWCDQSFPHNDTFKRHCVSENGKPPRYYNHYSTGPTIVLLPFTALGFFLDRSGFYTPSIYTPIKFWSIVGTFFLFLIGTLFLLEIAKTALQDNRTAFWITLFYVAGHSVLFYTFKRPLMAHAAEYMLFHGAAWAYVQSRFRAPVYWPLLTGMLAGLLFATRINDLLWVGVIGALFLFAEPRRKLKSRLTRAGLYALGGLPWLVWTVYANYLQSGSFSWNMSNHGGMWESHLIHAFDISNLRRFYDFFFGVHWGQALLMPFFFVEFYFVWKSRKLVRHVLNKHLIAAVVIAIPTLYYLNMMANGLNHFAFSFRLLLGVFFAVHLAFLGICYLNRGQAIAFFKKKSVFIISAVLTVIGAFQVLNYNRTPELTQRPTRNIEAGVYRKVWAGQDIINVPRYAVKSLAYTFSGKAAASIGASPLVAYPTLLLNAAGVQVGPILSKYQNNKRKIYKLSDLTGIFEYQAVIAFFLLTGFGIWGLKSHHQTYSRQN